MVGNQDGHARRSNIFGEVIDICVVDLAQMRALEAMMKRIQSLHPKVK